MNATIPPRKNYGWAWFLSVLASAGALAATPVSVRLHVGAADLPCVQWGSERVREALEQSGCKVTDNGTVTIAIDVAPSAAAKPEGYRLKTSRTGVVIIGADGAGAMYGCLELARRVRAAGGLPADADVADGPAMSLRGTCILLMKLGSYDYAVTPKEFPFFYDKGLWTQYLDFLAENGFNYIAFWNGHPFDYFVKLDRYPEAQAGLEPGLLARNHEMLTWLANEAQKRNLWLMFQFYNIHVSVYFAKAHHLPEHGIAQPTALLRDYTGLCLERFVSEFPSVGLYICPGEALEMEHTAEWINQVIFAAVKRTGKTPPIMIRSWGIDLEHMKQVAGNYPRLYTERKFNVEMLASTGIDPENAAWAKLSANHVVNIHCVANLEPFRWSPPSYIQQCIESSLKVGATGLHLYPRKAWRWPYGCDRGAQSELQWQRDWMWFEAWGRYAWQADRDPGAEREHWLTRLAERYGPGAAGPLLRAAESGADVLPAIQRLVWLGNDNHTIVSAGITLEQLARANGIPFLPTPGVRRIPDYLAAVAAGESGDAGSPVEFLARKAEAARQALTEAKQGAASATRNTAEAGRIATDAEEVLQVARFYQHKCAALAAKTRFDRKPAAASEGAKYLANLRASVEDFRALTAMTQRTYESLSDVPAWNPTPDLPCPYHWRDVLPLFEKELAEAERGVAAQAHGH
jgi:hypothetical protein